MLGSIFLRRLPVPFAISLALGAAAESTIVFLLLVCGVANRVSFLVLGVACLAVFWFAGRGAARIHEPSQKPADRITLYLAGAALACFGALYVINAMAPELEPDARAYHLGLTAEYVRLGAFPGRVGFYEMLPQGLEMLFVPAFAFGNHSAARLVHCAFLLATLPLMLSIGRRLKINESAVRVASVLYFCAPVAGITGTSTYTDAGGVFFTLATFYVLLLWRDTRDLRYLAVAGITAGFCYAIKLPGALAPILAIVFVVAVERRVRLQPLALLTGAALLVAAPWMSRAALLTGNPVAPLFNRFFPNPYFHLKMEQDLAATLRSSLGLPGWRIPYELFVGGAFGGVLGPVFFALPVALLSLRYRAGRWCLIAAALLALPWLSNTGARFLMPALPFLALALVMPLPRPWAWFCILVQAVGCWPQIFALYHPANVWRLERIPWRAALRVQPEQDYLAKLLPTYSVARMLAENTQPDDRIFSLTEVPKAYTDRETLEFWHSAEADRLSDALYTALTQPGLSSIRADWTRRPLDALRIRVSRPSPLEWVIHKIQLFSGARQVFATPQWELRAWPNPWELPLAFEENRAARWRTWEPVRAGMYVEMDFGAAQPLSAAVLLSPSEDAPLALEFYGRQGREWKLLTKQVTVAERPMGNIRWSAAKVILHAGFRYILASSGAEGNGPLGADMLAHTEEWGLQKVAEHGPDVLFRIK